MPVTGKIVAKTPRVSVVVPAFNVERYVRRTIQSLLDQTVPLRGVVVVDDGSTDDTLSTVHDMLGNSGDIQVQVITQQNAGVSSARNRGLEHSTGDFVLFLDGDDYVSATLSEIISGAVGQEEPDIVFWRFSHVTEDQRSLPTFEHCWNDSLIGSTDGPQVLRALLMTHKYCVWIGSAAYRREFLLQNDLRFTPGCATAEDSEFVWRAFALAERVVFVDEELSYYVARGGSVTNTIDLRRFDGVFAFHRTANFLASLPHIPDSLELSETVATQIVPRYFSTLARMTSTLGCRALVSSIEQRHPGIGALIKERIRLEMRKPSGAGVTRLLFLASPVAACCLLRRRRAPLAVFPYRNSGIDP